MKRLVVVVLGVLLTGCSTPENEAFRPPAEFWREQPPVEPGPARAAGIPVLGEAGAPAPDGVAAELGLETVLDSVSQHFPLILAAAEEVGIAAGREQAARGAFDTRFAVEGRVAATGFYEQERLRAQLVQPTPLFGSSFSFGYRLGQGDFAVYDGGEKTNEGGELRLGARLPLLQGRAVDPARISVWKSRVAQQAAQPIVDAQRLAAERAAGQAYWSWVARGVKLRIAEDLLRLAEDRAGQIGTAVQEGQLAAINVTENQRLVVDRRVSLIDAERDLQEAAIALSLFLRDDEGLPRVPPPESLPVELPSLRDPAVVLLEDDVAISLERRPEVRALKLDRQSLELDRELADNQQLPGLDLDLFASQDLGRAVNDPDDKEEFELGAGLSFRLPLQRSRARGREAELRSRIDRLDHELRLVYDRIVAEVQDARSALSQSWRRFAEAQENLRLARQLEQAERRSLALGESDLFRINLREQQGAVAASQLVDIQAEYLRSLIRYQTALGTPR